MRKSDSKGGFSLTEVLLAVGTLAIGMLLVAGVFPVSIHFTTIATERTIAAVAADEAFAKIRLYAEGDPNNPDDNIDPATIAPYNLTDFNDVYTDWRRIYAARTGVPLPLGVLLPVHEFAYPSDGTVNIFGKQYFWSALCRRLPEDYLLDLTDPNSFNSINRLVQITVFVSRRISPNLLYPWSANPTFPVLPQPGLPYVYPRPVLVPVRPFPLPTDRPVGELTDELFIIDDLPMDGFEQSLINDGSTIVDNRTGRIYRVLERYTPTPNVIQLDRDWIPPLLPGQRALVWVVPPPLKDRANPAAGVAGRYPCIAVYQKIIRF